MGWWPLSNKQQEKRQPRFMTGQEEYVFRRSRTLTGTTSNKVSVIAEGRGQLKTARLKLHELRQYRLRILKVLGGVGAVVGVVVFLASVYITSPAVRFAESTGRQPNVQGYTQTIQEYLATRPLERFGFLTNSEGLQAYIKQKHLEVRMVGVDKTWFGGDFGVNMYFREPLLTWSAAGQKYYVDDQGYAFSYNHFAEPAVSVTDESGIAPEVGGGAVASARFVSFLGRMVGALNQYGKGKVESVTLPASTREINIRLQGRTTLIRTHIDRDPLQQAEDIANAMAYFDARGAVPDYVDVRVAGKAFYK